MRLMHGLLAPSSGTVVWSGDNARRKQAMVFQRPVLLRRSALANVTYALKLARVPQAERAGLALEALDSVGLAPRREPAGDGCFRAASSSGSRWRGPGRCIPRCCFSTSRPRTSTRARRARSSAVIQAFDAAGTKIIMATHNLGQARRLGDEVLFLHQGRLVERAPVEQFFSRPASPEAAAFIKGELPWV